MLLMAAMSAELFGVDDAASLRTHQPDISIEWLIYLIESLFGALHESRQTKL